MSIKITTLSIQSPSDWLKQWEPRIHSIRENRCKNKKIPEVSVFGMLLCFCFCVSCPLLLLWGVKKTLSANKTSYFGRFHVFDLFLAIPDASSIWPLTINYIIYKVSEKTNHCYLSQAASVPSQHSSSIIQTHNTSSITPCLTHTICNLIHLTRRPLPSAAWPSPFPVTCRWTFANWWQSSRSTTIRCSSLPQALSTRTWPCRSQKSALDPSRGLGAAPDRESWRWYKSPDATAPSTRPDCSTHRKGIPGDRWQAEWRGHWKTRSSS